MSDSSPDDATPAFVPGVVDHRISEQEFLQARPRNQLRLRHLFALMAVMAVLLTVSRPQRIDFGNLPVKFPAQIYAVQAVAVAIQQIPASIALTALGFGIVGYRSGKLFFNQPGHWLLVELSLLSLLSLPSAIAMHFVEVKPGVAPN